ncbi:hypothetical protein M8J76_013250 [Diaphorina citri]|nr:hypothetical protein M8J76_013250 [Diaphorina citri]
MANCTKSILDPLMCGKMEVDSAIDLEIDEILEKPLFGVRVWEILYGAFAVISLIVILLSLVRVKGVCDAENQPSPGGSSRCEDLCDDNHDTRRDEQMKLHLRKLDQNKHKFKFSNMIKSLNVFPSRMRHSAPALNVKPRELQKFRTCVNLCKGRGPSIKLPFDSSRCQIHPSSCGVAR